MELKGSKTEQNLLAAFVGESGATNKYAYFASVAKKEGYEQIAGIFTETSGNEKEHAKIWAKALGLIGSTKENLQAAMDGENYEWTEMYRTFAQEAQTEGFDKIAKQFLNVAKVEEEHEKRYKKFLENLLNGNIFKKDTQCIWLCRNCGHVHIGQEAPMTCPTCDHPQSYFELKNENY